MNIHETYVNLETAKLLKQAGFDWECETHYHNGCLDSIYGENHDYNSERYEDGGYNEYYSAPTIEVAQRWLRENKDFDINVLTDFDSVKRLYYVRYVVKDEHYKTYYISNNRSYVYFNTYEEAQEAGIKKALEMILEKGE